MQIIKKLIHKYLKLKPHNLKFLTAKRKAVAVAVNLSLKNLKFAERNYFSSLLTISFMMLFVHGSTFIRASEIPSINKDHVDPECRGTFAGPLLIASADRLKGSGFKWAYLEDFDDQKVNAPGLSGAGRPSSTFGAKLIDSVSGDAWWGSGALEFSFSSKTLGSLPTHAGLVWTDGGGSITFEAWGPCGYLGKTGPHTGFPDSDHEGGKGEDRYFGVKALGGISRIRISNRGGIEVDNLRYALITPVNTLTRMRTPEEECKQKDSSGNYIVPVCSSKCQSKYWRWSFWVTNYNVSNTWGNGEHQGIGIFGYEYAFDQRFRPSSSKEPWVKRGSSDFLKKVSHPDNKVVRTSALCKRTPIVERFIHNHGRTIARIKADGYKQPPIKRLNTFTVGPLDYSKWKDNANSDMKRQAAATPCVRQIKDGYCDSVCGNCSYVVPKGPGIGTIDKEKKLRNQHRQFTIAENFRGITNNTIYYGISPDGRPHAFWDSIFMTANELRLPDPFTHCYSPSNPRPQQALTAFIGTLLGNEHVITGLFGHNSNTDAAAEFSHFETCATNPFAQVRRLISVSPGPCKLCGNPRTQNNKPIQFPCLQGQESNEARAKWNLTDGLHNIDDENVGKNPTGGPPICLTNGQPVRGM